MSFDLWLGLAAATVVLAYLVFALLRPEKF